MWIVKRIIILLYEVGNTSIVILNVLFVAKEFLYFCILK